MGTRPPPFSPKRWRWPKRWRRPAPSWPACWATSAPSRPAAASSSRRRRCSNGRSQIDSAFFGAGAPELDERRNNLAIVAWQLGDLPRAQELFERALASKEKREGADHPDVVALLNNLGILLREQGEAGEAEALHRRALEIGGRVLGPRHPDLASVWFSLGRALALLGRRPAAIAAFEQAIAIHRAARGELFFEIGRARVQIAELERQNGDVAAAAAELERAAKVLAGSVGADHPAMEELRQARRRLSSDRAAAATRSHLSRPPA